jgi:hypothetical protein
MISDADIILGLDDRTMEPHDAGGCFPLCCFTIGALTGGYSGDVSGYSGDVSF